MCIYIYIYAKVLLLLFDDYMVLSYVCSVMLCYSMLRYIIRSTLSHDTADCHDCCRCRRLWEFRRYCSSISGGGRHTREQVDFVFVDGCFPTGEDNPQLPVMRSIFPGEE